jgi:hypothetical protein
MRERERIEKLEHNIIENIQKKMKENKFLFIYVYFHFSPCLLFLSFTHHHRYLIEIENENFYVVFENLEVVKYQ